MTVKELKYHNLYLDLAQRIALMSYAVRAKVGAIMVKGGSILDYGWNGTPSGFDNECEYVAETIHLGDNKYTEILKTKDEVLHAESNCISKVAKRGVSSDESTLYLTMAPCFRCSKMIIQSGIKEVYYRGDYCNDDGSLKKEGIELLNKAQIPVIQIKKNSATEDYP